jgi:hypothetical protein
MIILGLIIISTMFSYHPTLPIREGDNSVSIGLGFMLTKLVWCVASIEEKLGATADPLQPLEFPRFDATGEPFSWLIDYEKYFHARRTPDHKRVTYVSFYLLDDVQLWYYRLPNNGSPPTWDRFVKLVINQFTLPFTVTPSSKPTLGDGTTAPEGAGNNTILAACGEGVMSACPRAALATAQAHRTTAEGSASWSAPSATTMSWPRTVMPA